VFLAVNSYRTSFSKTRLVLSSMVIGAIESGNLETLNWALKAFCRSIRQVDVVSKLIFASVIIALFNGNISLKVSGGWMISGLGE